MSTSTAPLTRAEQISHDTVRGLSSLPARVWGRLRRAQTAITAPRVQAGALALLALAALLYVVRPFPRYEYTRFGNGYIVTRHDRWTGAYERGHVQSGPWVPAPAQ